MKPKASGFFGCSSIKGDVKSMLHKLYRFFILSLTFLSIIMFTFQIPEAKLFLGVNVGIMFVILVLYTRGSNRIFYSLFFIFGLILTLFYKIPFSKTLEHLASNTIFIALFVCTPLLKIPIEKGKYLDEMVSLIESRNQSNFLYVMTIINFFLSSFLNLASIRLLSQLSSKEVKENPITYSAFLSRSFSLAACWTPYFASFSVAISYSNGNSLHVIAIGILLCAIILTTTVLPKLIKLKKSETVNSNPAKRGKVIQLFTFLGALLTSITVVDYLIDTNTVVIIILLSVFYSILWSIIQGSFRYYLKEVRRIFSQDLSNIRDEAFLFISIGFLSNTIIWLNWKIALPEWKGLSLISVWMFIFVFIIFVVLIAIMGVHHLVTITLLTASLNWNQLGIDPVVYAMLILTSWSLSSMVSPFSAANLIVSRLAKQKPAKIGLFMNGRYALGVLLFNTTILSISNYLISA
ncbi:hypothetical protein [Peribacillus simplex]|uniref:hypothetical protein n=1 Tax=Peribacillus simplex TaxID=1478 RepID=UPI00333C1DD4